MKPRPPSRRDRISPIPQGEPWVPISQSLAESQAFRSLSASAIRILWRIILEHMAHGGNENGHLPVTYDDFVAYGVRRQSIPGALRELEDVGLVVRTEKGKRAFGAFPGSASKYRLTFLPSNDGSGRKPATDEWRTAIVEQPTAVDLKQDPAHPTEI